MSQRGIACIVASVILTTSLAAQCETQRLVPADGQPADSFANALARWGDRMIVGSVYDDGIGEDSGSAYVFEQQGGTWVQKAKLIASDETADDRFGWAVGIHESTAVVGARYNDDVGYGSGSAYVFERNGGQWVETAYLTASDESMNALYGQSVDVSGGIVVVGSMRAEGPPGVLSGAVYLYEKVGGTWTETHKLFPAGAQADDRVGTSVAIFDRLLVVGARGVEDDVPQAGAAHVFEYDGSTWNETGLLTSPSPEEGALFGQAVAAWGNVILVGALLEDAVGLDAGAVYVFEKQAGAWVQTGRLVPDDTSTLTYFGASFDVWGDNALVGAWSDEDLGFRSGAVYGFQKRAHGWEQTGKLWASDAQPSQQFGESISMWGTDAIVGATGGKNAAGQTTGAVYAIDNIGSIANYGGGCPGTGGVVPHLRLSGCASPGGSLTVTIDEGRRGSLAVLFLGAEQASLPLVGCTLLVYPLLPLHFVLPLDSLGKSVVNGQLPATVSLPFSFSMQAFVQDPNAAAGFSATNAVDVTLAP
jgi:hypothetical protein